ncbi:uncharacterized protein AB675_6496 [Cyphellophora attinorum]|uniref:Fe2OG dioxygenase domain-containing protein n=1 Tax=Cyphellophora attinorum TaxID=1664694 RepID=A0A0N0NQB7_9EURO|nr:uncharacterized protein AB675_6496 [Phialophora attinorum]KPI43721.1 hypothetical protein AB675_6496 [Phialophora attinorum]
MSDHSDARNSVEHAPPPSSPPPLLPIEALDQLCDQGWLRLALPPDLLAAAHRLQTLASNFFDQSSTDDKQKEYLTLRCCTNSSSTSAVEEAAADYWAQTTNLMINVLADALSPYLEIPSTIWDDVISPPRKRLALPENVTTMPASEADIHSGTLLRLFRYFPRNDDQHGLNMRGEGDMSGGAGMHTDLGLLTLCIGQRGLECFDLSRQQYIDVLDAPAVTVRPIADPSNSCTTYNERDEAPQDQDLGAVLLLGQTIRGLTHQQLPAGVHRVRPLPATGRESIVFALRHAFGDIDLRPWGLGDGKVSAKDLYRWLGVGKVSVNAAAGVRERQLAELARSNGNEE